MEKIKKINELINSEEFADEIENLETIEELQAAFKNHGVEMTADEIIDLGTKIAVSGDGEISEDDLKNVAGGVNVNSALRIVARIVSKMVNLYRHR
jgi:hypothetical protein